MILKYDHVSVFNGFVVDVGICFIVEVVEFILLLLDYLVVIILLTVIKVMSSHTGTGHALSNLLSGDESSEVSLNFNDQSNFIHGVIVSGSRCWW